MLYGTVASNLLPSDAAGPVFFEAHEITSEMDMVNMTRLLAFIPRDARENDGEAGRRPEA